MSIPRHYLRALRRLHKSGDAKRFKSVLKDAASYQWGLELKRMAAIKRQHDLHIRMCRAESKRAKNADKRRLRKEAEERRQRQAMEMARIGQTILPLIQKRQLAVTAAFMKTIKDPDLKRKIIEATCLSKV